MAAATVNLRQDIHDPNQEVVQLLVTDGNTFTSQKFTRVTCAVASFNGAENATSTIQPQTTGSTGVVTLNCDGVTQATVTLVVYGNLGN